ncbi:hypothetical protein Ancab_038324 [Ancistrocladus abbreviatus]
MEMTPTDIYQEKAGGKGCKKQQQKQDEEEEGEDSQFCVGRNETHPCWLKSTPWLIAWHFHICPQSPLRPHVCVFSFILFWRPAAAQYSAALINCVSDYSCVGSVSGAAEKLSPNPTPNKLHRKVLRILDPTSSDEIQKSLHSPRSGFPASLMLFGTQIHTDIINAIAGAKAAADMHGKLRTKPAMAIGPA